LTAGLNLPVFLTGAGDGSGRLFVESQTGVISMIRDGVVLDQPYLDISDKVSKPASNGYYGERGLLGLAFHPRFKENGYFYVNYTDRDGNTVIARYTASPEADQADPQSEVRLLQVEQPYANHNGGMLTFGPDGYLYIGLGDGGSGGDPQGNGQSTQELLGKILRIDVDQGNPYASPPDNPFAAGGGRSEVWAYGLRNPWSLPDLLTHDLYIGDVYEPVEEIDFCRQAVPGSNLAELLGRRMLT
jgi:glucose/arabinose dehydrogenase